MEYKQHKTQPISLDNINVDYAKDSGHLQEVAYSVSCNRNNEQTLKLHSISISKQDIDNQEQGLHSISISKRESNHRNLTLQSVLVAKQIVDTQTQAVPAIASLLTSKVKILGKNLIYYL